MAEVSTEIDQVRLLTQLLIKLVNKQIITMEDFQDIVGEATKQDDVKKKN